MLRLIPLLLLAQMPALPATGTALVVGRVIDQADQRPISGVAVTLMRQGEFASVSEQPRRQITDALGRFVFRELPGGQYSLETEYGGTGFSPSGFIQSGFGFRIGAYLNGGYGQRRPGGPLQPLALADGQAISDIVIQMWKGAAISGVVVDDLGEPVVDTVIGAAQLSGDGRLISGPTVRTDDRGMYRLSALAPGRYIVFVPQTTTAMSAELADDLMRRIGELAIAKDPAAVPAPAPELTGIRVGSAIVKTASSGLIDGNLMPRRDGDAIFVYQTTFYPNAASLASAVPIQVASGDDRNGVDVSLQPVRAATISGTLSAGGVPAAAVRLHLVPATGPPDAALFEVASAQTDGLGRFTFPLVPVGSYRITAANDPVSPGPASAATQGLRPPGGPGAWVNDAVSVGPEGLKELALSLRPGLSVKGQVEFSGVGPTPTEAELSKMTIGVRPAAPRARNDPSGGAAQAIAAAGGAFAAVGVAPGRYVVRVTGLPPNSPWRLQSVTIGGRDVNDLPFDLAEDVANARVIFSDRPSAVSGRVTSSSPDEGAAAVLLFPADRALWPDARAMMRRTRMVRTGGAGEFNFADVPAGDYFIVAVPDAATAEWPDATFLAKAATAATSVRLNAGDRPSLSLTVKRLQ
jgi:hypothetical protein